MAQRQITHRNTQTIWLFDYPSFTTLSDEANRLIFLSERDWNMIWQATKDIDLWQSRVWVEASGESYLSVDDTQFEQWQNWVSEMRIHLGDFEMLEEILQEINVTLQALVNKPCCPDGGTSGSRGSGSTEVPPNPYDQEETPTEPPPGFEDMETFEAHKCNQAQDILDQLQADLVGLSGIIYSGQSPTGLVGAIILFLLTPIPFDELIALSAYLIYSAFSYTFLAEMAAQIEEFEDDLRCILYDSPDAISARINLLAEIETIAGDHFPTPSDAEWVVGAVEYMLTYDSLNRLFENLPTVSQDADCASCGEPDCNGSFTLVNCTLVSGDLEMPTAGFTIQSTQTADIGGLARHWAQVYQPPCGLCLRLGIESSGWTIGNLQSFNIGNGYFACDGGDVIEVTYDSPDSLSGQCFQPIASNGFQFNSRTPFTVTFTVEEVDCEMP